MRSLIRGVLCLPQRGSTQTEYTGLLARASTTVACVSLSVVNIEGYRLPACVFGSKVEVFSVLTPDERMDHRAVSGY